MRNGEALPLTGTAIAALKAGSLDNEPTFVARERLWRISARDPQGLQSLVITRRLKVVR